MIDNTTELLNVIEKGMSEEGVEVTNVKLYEEVVELNNKVKVRISESGYLINRASEFGVFRRERETSMLIKVLEIFKESEWLPGDVIEAYGEWFTLVVEEYNHYTESNKYCSYRLLDDSHTLSERKTLEDLKNNYTNESLIDGRLK